MGLTVGTNCGGTSLFTAWGEHAPLSTTSKDIRKLMMQLAEKAPSLYPFMYMNDVNTDTFLGRIVDALLSSGDRKLDYKTIAFDQKISFYPQVGLYSSPCHAIYTLNYPKSRMSARFKALLFAYRPDTFVSMCLVKYPVPWQPIAFTREEREVLGQFFDILIGPGSYGHRGDDLAGYLAHTGLQFEEPVQSPGLFITDVNTGLPYPSIPNDADWKGDIRLFTEEEAIKTFGDDPTKPKVELSRTPQEAIDAGKREAERPKADALRGQSQNQATQHNEVSTQSIASKQAIGQQVAAPINVTPSSDKVNASNSTKSSNSHGDVMDEEPYAGTARNAPCPCGSGKKYKDCHGKDDAAKTPKAEIRENGATSRSNEIKGSHASQIEAIKQQAPSKDYFDTLLKSTYAACPFDTFMTVFENCGNLAKKSDTAVCMALIDSTTGLLSQMDDIDEWLACFDKLMDVFESCRNSLLDRVESVSDYEILTGLTEVGEALYNLGETMPSLTTAKDKIIAEYAYTCMGAMLKMFGKDAFASIRHYQRVHEVLNDSTYVVPVDRYRIDSLFVSAFKFYSEAHKIDKSSVSCRHLAETGLEIGRTNNDGIVRSTYCTLAVSLIDECLAYELQDASELPKSLEVACKIYREVGDDRFAETLERLKSIDPEKAEAFMQ